MAKRKTRTIYRTRPARRHKRPGMRIPLAVVAGFIPLGVGIWNRKSQPANLGPYVLGSLTGYVPGQGFNMQYMSEGALPIAAGFIAHSLASKLGINRLLGRAGVPLVRI